MSESAAEISIDEQPSLDYNFQSSSSAGLSQNDSYHPSRPLSERVTRAFLAADIPLKKLRNPHIQKLFLSMNNPAPSESTCRRKLDLLSEEVQNKVKTIVENTNVGIFVIFDESSMDGVSYASTLVGTMEDPSVTYLLATVELEKPLTAQLTCQLIDDQLRKFSLDREKVLLLISDAASYMVKAAESLKIFYGKMSHVTCTSHLLHNACTRVRSAFPEVDTLIASVKAATRKNRSRKEMFRREQIPVPPAPVVTRWGSWLKAAFYYGRHFCAVEKIFDELSGGKLVEKAKQALKNATVFQSLTSICSQYQILESVFDHHIDTSFTVEKAHNFFKNIDFGEDCCRVKPYLLKRLKKNDLTTIVERKDPSISPLEYAHLQKCQSTSIAVEHSFSMLKKMNAQDRNFKKDNIGEYLRCKFNSHVL